MSLVLQPLPPFVRTAVCVYGCVRLPVIYVGGFSMTAENCQYAECHCIRVKSNQGKLLNAQKLHFYIDELAELRAGDTGPDRGESPSEG